tara:strand:+ start:1913 stop:2449 length:537 start_codon:yes stop_codon:yes gene_type:complete
MTDNIKPLRGCTVGKVCEANTLPGAARALAVVYIDDAAGEAAGSVSFGLNGDDKNTAAACLFADAMSGTERYLMLLRAAEERAVIAEAGRKAEHAARRASDQRLARTLTGQSLVFGEVLITITERGEAWMQNPAKGDSGFGLCFPSLADLWQRHPELRPVRWVGGQLICAALAMTSLE